MIILGGSLRSPIVGGIAGIVEGIGSGGVFRLGKAWTLDLGEIEVTVSTSGGPFFA